MPSAQLVPTEPVRSAGANTLHLPAASIVKNGRSRLTGVEASVVYGGFGYPCAGAPSTPANTWFHTAFDHDPMSLLRTKYCCCDPFVTDPVTESAINPPLAYDGPVQ